MWKENQRLSLPEAQRFLSSPGKLFQPLLLCQMKIFSEPPIWERERESEIEKEREIKEWQKQRNLRETEANVHSFGLLPTTTTTFNEANHYHYRIRIRLTFQKMVHNESEELSLRTKKTVQQSCTQQNKLRTKPMQPTCLYKANFYQTVQDLGPKSKKFINYMYLL